MNSFTDFATTVIELPKVTLAGIGLGSSIAKVASHYIIDAGKEMYIKHESSNCTHPRLQKIAGIAFMGFGLLAGLTLSGISGIATGILVTSCFNPCNYIPFGLALTVIAEIAVVIFQVITLMNVFTNAIKEIEEKCHFNSSGYSLHEID